MAKRLFQMLVVVVGFGLGIGLFAVTMALLSAWLW